MPYAGPGGLPPSMGQYGQYSQTPPYSYMNPQAPYFNPMGGSSYGGYPQGSSAYPNAAGSTGFSGNSSHQYGGHPKYQGYGNQGRFDSNLADMTLGQRSIIVSFVLTSCWIVCQKHKRAASMQHRWQVVPHAKVQHSIEQKWQCAVLRGC